MLIEYPHRGQSYFCSWHKEWEVDDGDPQANVLCEWCCHPKPCPLHGETGTTINEEGEETPDVFDVRLEDRGELRPESSRIDWDRVMSVEDYAASGED